MRPTRWLIGIGAVLAVGALQTVSRNALFVKAYELGAARHALRRETTSLSWLRAEVITLASPSTLLDAAAAHRLSLVARASLPIPAAQPQIARLVDDE